MQKLGNPPLTLPYCHAVRRFYFCVNPARKLRRDIMAARGKLVGTVFALFFRCKAKNYLFSPLFQ